MEILGFSLALLVGISLGLIGSGGSILTVPILVYIMGVSPILATAYSLFIVGSTAVVGAVKNGINRTLDFKTAIVFGIPSIIAVYITRAYLVPNIPDTLFQSGNFVLTKDLALMVFFAIVMIIAAFSMLKSKRTDSNSAEDIQYNIPLIIAEGLLIGVVTGLVGAGGGFLIIPALVILARLPMKLAVGTSLMIISMKSLIGFIGDFQNTPDMDYKLLLIFSSLSIIGMFIGNYMTKFIDGKKLKKGFGWFVLVMGVYIILKELL